MSDLDEIARATRGGFYAGYRPPERRHPIVQGFFYACGAAPILVVVGLVIYMLIEQVWAQRLQNARDQLNQAVQHGRP